MDIKVDAKTVIVFDLDDTLYNEIDYLRSAYRAIAQKLRPDGWQALFGRMFSMYRCGEDVFKYLSDTHKIPKDELLKHYREHDPDIVAFEGVQDVLGRIKDNNGKIGIITDGRGSTQRKKLDALGLTDMVDEIVISGETGYEKPEEHNFRTIADSFQEARYWYIADNLRKDFIAPRRLGWHTIGLVDNGLNVHHDGYRHFEKAKMPHEFILSFKEIRIV